MNRYLITYQYPDSEPVAMVYQANTQPTETEAAELLGPPVQRAAGLDPEPVIVSVEPLDDEPEV